MKRASREGRSAKTAVQNCRGCRPVARAQHGSTAGRSLRACSGSGAQRLAGEAASCIMHARPGAPSLAPILPGQRRHSTSVKGSTRGSCSVASFLPVHRQLVHMTCGRQQQGQACWLLSRPACKRAGACVRAHAMWRHRQYAATRHRSMDPRCALPPCTPARPWPRSPLPAPRSASLLPCRCRRSWRRPRCLSCRGPRTCRT